MKSDLNRILQIPNYTIKRTSGIMCKALNLLMYVTQTTYTKEQLKSKSQLQINKLHNIIPMHKIKKKEEREIIFNQESTQSHLRIFKRKYKHYLTFIIKTKSEKLRKSTLKQIRNTQD